MSKFRRRLTLMVLLGAIAASVWACSQDSSTEDELRGRLEGFFEAVLTGDATSLDELCLG